MALSRTLDGHQGASGFAASCRLVPVCERNIASIEDTDVASHLQCGLAYEQ